MEESSCNTVPPGFRFHPTEEEHVGYYLARKVSSHKIDLDIIQEVDLYRIEPWDLQGTLFVRHFVHPACRARWSAVVNGG